ncbi:unnamed protein product [Effrenium voratum]|nr:unnamed protein product [Effrenium voratum]
MYNSQCGSIACSCLEGQPLCFAAFLALVWVTEPRIPRMPSPQGVFNEMVALRISPDQRAFAMLLSAYGNASPKQAEAAEDLFQRMPRQFQTGLVRDAMRRCRQAPQRR